MRDYGSSGGNRGVSWVRLQDREGIQRLDMFDTGRELSESGGRPVDWTGPLMIPSIYLGGPACRSIQLHRLPSWQGIKPDWTQG